MSQQTQQATLNNTPSSQVGTKRVRQLAVLGWGQWEEGQDNWVMARVKELELKKSKLAQGSMLWCGKGFFS